jgi:hypothetical protein
MRSRTSILLPAVGLLVPFLLSASSQDLSPPTVYDASEAYQVYNLLIPHEEAYDFGKAIAIIQEDTVSEPLHPACFEAKAATRFKEALADYRALQSQKWMLQRHFQIERPYELVRSDTIGQFFQERGPEGWKDFHERYPEFRWLHRRLCRWL